MQRIYFDVFSLDVVNKRLWEENEPVRLSLKAFDVLSLLVLRCGQLVKKEELLATVWPKSVAGDAVLKMSIREIRRALNDDSRNPRLIETVHRRGYTFIGKVSATGVASNDANDSAKHQPPVRGVQSLSPILADAVRALPMALVGRTAELQRLTGIWRTSLNGQRQVVFVTGEMGVGKTTLINALLREIRDDATPIHFLRGHCLAHHRGKDIYLPLLEALGCLSRIPGFESRLSAVLRRYAPSWLIQMPALVDAAERERLRSDAQGAARERMLRELVDAVHALALERPLLLVLENLHWSDDFTLDFVGLLAHRVEPSALLLICTYRPEEVPLSEHPLCALKGELDAHQQCSELDLALLTQEQTAQYVQQRFGGGAVPGKVIQRLHHWANGNCFFMSSVIDHWAADGITAELLRTPGAMSLLERELVLVPQTVRQTITARIERLLSSDDIALLEAASLVGLEFSAGQVADAIDADVVDIEQRCELLARRSQFIQPLHRGRRRDPSRQWPDRRAATRYAFIHPLCRQVLQERIAIARQNRLRSKIKVAAEVTCVTDSCGLGLEPPVMPNP